MSLIIHNIITNIKLSVEGVIATQEFKNWFQGQRSQDGDLVILNNSFIYRKPVIKTSKNEQYLCLTVMSGQASTTDLSVVKPGEINSKFKLFNARSANLPEPTPLDKAVQDEMQRIGSLVFVLIGELQDTECDVALNHSAVKSLKYDPIAQIAHVQDSPDGGKAVVVNQLTDSVAAWNAIKGDLPGPPDSSTLATAFDEAFEKLRNNARKRLIVPKPGETRSKTSVTLLSQFHATATEQRELYNIAINEYILAGAGADAHLREAMRIAYNFAGDAIKVLELLVSVADLKAVLLWCTIKEHFDVSEAFSNLPWTKSQKKPSLVRYQEIISGARNRAFHNLLAPDRTVEANLEGIQIGARRLTLFPSYSRRKSNIPLDYEDREIVQVLSELTYAPDVTVSLEFWKKNVEVMNCFENLLAATESSLWLLNSVRSA